MFQEIKRDNFFHQSDIRKIFFKDEMAQHLEWKIWTIINLNELFLHVRNSHLDFVYYNSDFAAAQT